MILDSYTSSHAFVVVAVSSSNTTSYMCIKFTVILGYKMKRCRYIYKHGSEYASDLKLLAIILAIS